MSSIQVLPSKHGVIQFVRDLVQYSELMGGRGGRGCKIEEYAFQAWDIWGLGFSEVILTLLSQGC